MMSRRDDSPRTVLLFRSLSAVSDTFTPSLYVSTQFASVLLSMLLRPSPRYKARDYALEEGGGAKIRYAMERNVAFAHRTGTTVCGYSDEEIGFCR